MLSFSFKANNVNLEGDGFDGDFPNLLEDGFSSIANESRNENWVPHKFLAYFSDKNNRSRDSNKINQGEFSSALMKAKLFNNETISLPGAFLAYPQGVKFLHRMSSIIRKNYTSIGLEEYDYPCLAPYDCYAPVESLMPIQKKILKAVSLVEGDYKNGRCVLNPTGEEVIYSDWSRRLKSREDFPVKLFRQSVFYRPSSFGKHSGRGLFSSMEARDVFEFHACFMENSELDKYFDYTHFALDQIMKEFCLPSMWGVRPPWTNNNAISEWTLASDVLLPTYTTVQTGCIYYQNKIFSELYNIGYTQDGVRHTAHHLAGAVSRRILLTHLYLGLTPSGAFLVHPNVAPIQILILVRGTDDLVKAKAHEVMDCLKKDFRVDLVMCDNGEHVKSCQNAAILTGTPIHLLVAGKKGGETQILAVRADTYEEIGVDIGSEATGFFKQTLNQIGYSYSCYAQRFMRDRLVWPKSKIEAQEAMRSKNVVAVPIQPTKESVYQVAEWQCGEILSFFSMNKSSPCILTGKQTSAYAFMAGRI